QVGQRRALSTLHFRRDPQRLQRTVVRLELVHADDDPALLLDAELIAERGVGDLLLEPALLDPREHAGEYPVAPAEPLDLTEVIFRRFFDLVGERFHEPGATERIDH